MNHPYILLAICFHPIPCALAPHTHTTHNTHTYTHKHTHKYTYTVGLSNSNKDELAKMTLVMSKLDANCSIKNKRITILAPCQRCNNPVYHLDLLSHVQAHASFPRCGYNSLLHRREWYGVSPHQAS